MAALTARRVAAAVVRQRVVAPARTPARGVAARAGATPTPPPPAWTANGADVKVLHDGDCPLCEREVQMLKRRNPDHGNLIAFVDVADPDYDPASNAGISYATAMGTIHAIKANGESVTGVDVLYVQGLWSGRLARLDPIQLPPPFFFSVACCTKESASALSTRS